MTIHLHRELMRSTALLPCLQLAQSTASPCLQLAQNTAWILIFGFQSVFFDEGRRLPAENGRRTPPGSPFLIFRRCFQRAGAASRSGRGQFWHTNRFFRGLCARRAPSLRRAADNFGTQSGKIGFCVPGGRRLSLGPRSILAHKSGFSGFVCQAGAVSPPDSG